MASFVWIQTNQIERIEVALVNSSGFLTGATVTLKIRRKSDGYYWTGSAWQATAATINMTEVDSVNDPGKYYYNFDTTGLSADDYFFTAVCSAAANAPQCGVVRTGGYADYITSSLGRSIPMIQSVFSGQELDEIKKLIKEIETAIASLRSSIKESNQIYKNDLTESLSPVILALMTELKSASKNVIDELNESIEQSSKKLDSVPGILSSSRADIVNSLLTLAGNITKIIESMPQDRSGDIMQSMSNLLDSIKSFSEIKEKINLVEGIIVKTCDSKILEEVINENGG